MKTSRDGGRDDRNGLSRRRFLATVAGGGLAASSLSRLSGARGPARRVSGKARHCIHIWLGGGSCHIDTWDPKRRGDPEKRTPGSAYKAIPSAISGETVCEHLHRSAPLLDRAVLVRGVHHEVSSEHALAVNRMHTGRPTSGTVMYPSIGSVVAHEVGHETSGVPSYVVMGYPNLTRGPGFLGARDGFLYLTDTRSGPAGLTPPPSIDEARQQRRLALLSRLRQEYQERHPRDESIQNYSRVAEEAFRLAGPGFMSAFELEKEPSSLRESYGSEFGQRCLLARRLVERGVSFVEVAHNLNFLNGTGWDTHKKGQRNQHLLIRELDQTFSTLLLDLEKHNLLDRTLVVISTEFGRPPKFDGEGGRGHQSAAFSVVLAGGGLRTGQVVGQTDELGEKVLEEPVSVPDLFATIYSTLGIDPLKELYAGDRPVPITDQGKPILKLFG